MRTVYPLPHPSLLIMKNDGLVLLSQTLLHLIICQFLPSLVETLHLLDRRFDRFPSPLLLLGNHRKKIWKEINQIQSHKYTRDRIMTKHNLTLTEDPLTIRITREIPEVIRPQIEKIHNLLPQRKERIFQNQKLPLKVMLPLSLSNNPLKRPTS